MIKKAYTVTKNWQGAWEIVHAQANTSKVWVTRNTMLAYVGLYVASSHWDDYRFVGKSEIPRDMGFETMVNQAIEAEVKSLLCKNQMNPQKLKFAGDYNAISNLCFVCLSESPNDFIIIDKNNCLIGSTYNFFETRGLQEIVANAPRNNELKCRNLLIRENLPVKAMTIVDIRNFLETS